MADPQNLPAIRQQQLATVRTLLDKMKPQMQLVLNDPRHVDAIVRMAVTSCQRNPALLACDQLSLLGAVMQSAQLGLECDDVRGLAYLIPYGGKVTFVPGYRGLQFLALQTEGVQDIYAVLVHANDEFQVEQGSNPGIHHVPTMDEPGEVTAGYYMIVYTSGYRRFGTMRRDELDAIQKRALANKRNKDASPWTTDTEQMQLKTLIRRSAKTLPQNSRLSIAAELDAQAEAEQPQHLELLADPTAIADTVATDATAPTKAPRKSEKQTKEAAAPSAPKPPQEPEPTGDTQNNPAQSSQAAPASAAGSDGDSGSAAPVETTAPVTQATLEPLIGGSGKVSPGTLERLVDKMIELDQHEGKRIGLSLLKERYKQESASRLSEAEAIDFIEWMNGHIDTPAGGWGT